MTRRLEKKTLAVMPTRLKNSVESTNNRLESSLDSSTMMLIKIRPAPRTQMIVVILFESRSRHLHVCI
uniref:Uncharacterized protein n=1 Tax=Steinernema glaseri TaxID=37863 RepID=A0A1I8AFG0_9BILA